MNPQSQGTSSSSPADLPQKRKRGRPRKDDSLIQGESTPATPAADNMKKNKESTGATGAVGHEMVGKVVSGVIEGSFDAGYLLKVKVGDTETHLRGVVFLPGRYTPVSASNDVAPEAKMYKRTEMPIPVPIHPTQVPASVPSSQQSDKQPVDLQNHSPINQVKEKKSSELQSSVPIAKENQPSSNILPLTNNLPPISGTGPLLGGRATPQQIPETETRSQPASIIPQMGHEKVTEPNDMLKAFEASIIKSPNVNVEPTEQSKPMPQAAPCIPGTGTVNLELEIQHQVVSNDFKPNQACDGVKILEHNQVPVGIEPGIMSAEPPTGTKVPAEKQLSPKKVEPSELAAKTSSGNDASHLNGRPVNHAADNKEADSESASSAGLPVTLFEREAISSEPKLATEGSLLQRVVEPQLCSTGVQNVMKEDPNSAPVADLPVMLFEGEAVPSERKHVIDGPAFPRMTEPQFCITPSVSNNVESNFQDAIPSTES